MLNVISNETNGMVVEEWIRKYVFIAQLCFPFFSFLAPGREDKHIAAIRDINKSLVWDHVETMNWKVGHWDCEMEHM